MATIIDPITIVETGQMTATAIAKLTATCRIGRLVAGAWVQQSTSIVCRLDLPSKDFGVFQNAGIGTQLVFALQVPLATNLLLGDQVDVGGQFFYVNDTDKGRTGALVLTAYLTRVLSITW